jgi:hypothetical protein
VILIPGKTKTKKALPADQRKQLLETLHHRFEANTDRHKGIQWADVHSRLGKSPQKLWTLHEMEQTGGEPDVVAHDKKTGEYHFYDCCGESPTGRRSICYDPQALESRKQHKPRDSAIGMATRMGIEILTQEQYRRLQELGEFDTKTSSWIATPPEVRRLGGALFCDRRYNKVFVYHNGAESYYAARGFRGSLKV